jgi:hypothetical protein
MFIYSSLKLEFIKFDFTHKSSKFIHMEFLLTLKTIFEICYILQKIKVSVQY